MLQDSLTNGGLGKKQVDGQQAQAKTGQHYYDACNGNEQIFSNTRAHMLSVGTHNGKRSGKILL
jgi:hypothetical protein